MPDAPPDSAGPETLFHPAVASWFARRFPAGPTPPQSAAWPHIAAGRDVLVASPTGSGKTLTGFLVAIDAAYRAAEAGSGPTGTPEVLYISPLRALAVDVHENLHVPLTEIREEAARLGYPDPGLRIAIRTGDTPAAERAAMKKQSPDLLVTTPESLYLLLTAPSSRALLRGVRTVIVDEVHTLARDKRGSHLALSLERLDALVGESGGRLQRIGLSATQRPLDLVARLLSGVHDDRPPTVIVDCGHARDLDVAIELPSTELEAVMSGGQMSDILDRIAEHTRDHRTTLIFVNTRKMAERVAHQLAERLGENESADGNDVDASLLVAAHHGSLSAARRRIVETRLRAGDLRALVATASLELGIDVGPVELVCQIGSPRAIGTFLQRVGRANHHRDGTPAGRLYPTTRDELVECTALLAAVREGRLDLLEPPVAPLDVLTQQLVAEVASTEERDVEAMWAMTRRAAPYAELSRKDFDDVVALASWGIETGRGRRGAHLHLDAVNGRLRARRGARLAALTGGGAIPETGDYRVVLDPDGVTVGSVHEDFAVEATAGDIFLLGTHSWRVAKVEVGTVRVYDAGDLPPTIPFWLGEAPARTAELSEAVSDLRAALEPLLLAQDGDGARRLVQERAGVSAEVAQQVVAYCAAGLAALGHLPTRERVVVERCFDDSEGSQLIIHAPFGGRINRALGLALRKRFCVSFDFELQAAADDDTVVLSLGPQHSFPLTKVQSMLSSAKAPEVLTQAVLLHPMLGARWRWNLNRALVLPRMNGGKRRPIHLQRMEADDLLAAVWPGLAACQENAPPGPVGVPDHVLARQTVHDCLHEGLSVEGLVDVWSRIESGAIAVHTVESSEPSPFAHAILSGRPFTYLDDAPLEERRTRALSLRRGLGELGPDGLPVPAAELAALDPDAVAVVLDQVRPRLRNADELHDLLLSLGGGTPAPRMDAVVRSAGGRRPGGPGRRLLGGHGAPRRRAGAVRRRRGRRRVCGRSPAAGRSRDRRAVGGGRRRCPRVRRWGRRSRRPGPAPPWPGWRARAPPLRCPTDAGAHATCWCGCTAPAGAGAAAWSTRCRSPSTCASSRTGSTRRPTAASRDGPGCSRCWSSCRGSRRRRPSGRPRSCPPVWPATTRAGSTSSACPAKSCGGASRRGPSGPGAVARPRPPRRSPSCGATTSRTCCARCAPERRRRSPRSARRPTCSPPCGRAAPASARSWRR